MKEDVAIAALAAILATAYLYATAKLPAVGIGDPVGPKVYPAMLGFALLIAAAMVAVEGLRPGRRRSAGVDGAEPTSVLRSTSLVGGVAATLGFILLFEPLGFLLATSLYLLGMTFTFHPGHAKANAAVSILFALGSYALFQHVLGASLPPGLLSF